MKLCVHDMYSPRYVLSWDDVNDLLGAGAESSLPNRDPEPGEPLGLRSYALGGAISQSIGLWGHTYRAVLNEVRRVLIVLSKLVVNGAFPPVPDYSRGYEKQCKSR